MGHQLISSPQSGVRPDLSIQGINFFLHNNDLSFHLIQHYHSFSDQHYNNRFKLKLNNGGSTTLKFQFHTHDPILPASKPRVDEINPGAPSHVVQDVGTNTRCSRNQIRKAPGCQFGSLSWRHQASPLFCVPHPQLLHFLCCTSRG